MRLRSSPAVAAGLAAGLLFFAHALVPYSRAWPLVWPLLGGVAAAALASGHGRSIGAWARVRVGAAAGAIAGGLFLALTLVALFLLAQPGMEPTARVLGAMQPVVVTPVLAFAICIAAVVGVAASAVGGVAGGWVVRHRHA
jgi:hypothetical protein